MLESQCQASSSVRPSALTYDIRHMILKCRVDLEDQLHLEAQARDNADKGILWSIRDLKTRLDDMVGHLDDGLSDEFCKKLTGFAFALLLNLY